jgi:cytochrome c
MVRNLALVCLFAMLGVSAHPADVDAGRARFAAECSSCHSTRAGDSGGMGPNLNNIVGRPAATSDSAYSYSLALRNSKVVWDATTLNWFLADPYIAVPGTAMQMSVPDQAGRGDLVAYLISITTPAPRP